MGKLLNFRHEKFAREYIKTAGNGAEAYRRVYPRVEPLNVAPACASRLLRSAKVKGRIGQLQRAAMKRADITIDRLIDDIQRAKDIAIEDRKPNDITNASMAQAKLCGLLRDRMELGPAGAFDNASNVGLIMQQIRAELGDEEAERILQELQMDDASSSEVPTSETIN